ncbi:MAG TPA: ankyrin repeat domain-containing protein [Verrucomicrobiae bacterium]|nr:ankyrin repeat domain-containing protein [Verrucomicrobiae bacterium]
MPQSSSASDQNPGLTKHQSFLEAAVAGNQAEARQLLAELSPESRNDLFIAAMIGEADLVDEFLRRDRGAATRKGGPKNWGPLLYLSFSRFHQDDPVRAQGMARVAKALLAHGADPNTHYTWEHDEKIKLPVLWAATSESNNPALTRVLLEAGANPNDGESIYHAAEHNHRECLELLLEFGVNLSGPIQPWNNTPLYFILGHSPSSAAAADVLAGTRWLLEHGADPNAASYKCEGRPIHLAAAHGWGTELFELLFRHGADINIRQTDGKSAYVLAARHGNVAAMDWLRDHGAETILSPADEILAACGRGDETALKSLLTNSPGLTQSLPIEDKRMIVSAASNDRAEAVRLMLFAGIPVDTAGQGGETALHFAAWFGNIATVQVLLARGAPLEIRDTTYNAPPLGWACHGSLNCRNPNGDYVAVVKAFLAADAKSGKEFCGSEAVNEVLKGAAAR